MEYRSKIHGLIFTHSRDDGKDYIDALYVWIMERRGLGVVGIILFAIGIAVFVGFIFGNIDTNSEFGKRCPTFSTRGKNL
jgi:hypothetical protein